MDDSPIMCQEIIESFNKDVKKLNNKAKTILANFNENKATCEMQIFLF